MRLRAWALLAVAPLAVQVPAVAAPAYRSTIDPLTTAERAGMTPAVWRPGCPVPLGDLRVIRARHWDFSGRVRTGRLVVHADVAGDISRVLGRLFVARVPIRRMVPIEAYGGDDFASIEADNTSAFNCRAATGSRRWSEHAYGRAIDINPIENPYVSGGASSHRASAPYLDRRPRPGMAVEGGALVRAFDAIGWGWGGRWSGVRDYQHFSATGR